MSELLLNQFEQDRALAALRYKNLNIRNYSVNLFL